MTEYEKEQAENQIDGRHFVKKKQRERLIRKGRMKQERFRGFVRFFLTLFMLFALVYLANCQGWYMDKNAFNYVGGNSVEIINNKIIPSHKILALLKNSNVPDVPIYLARTNSIKKELMKLPPVENVYIRRYAFPARVQIIIRERVPVITISPDVKVSPVAFFTTDGKLIGREYMPLSKDYKTILVLSYGNKGDDYRKWDLKKIQQIQKIAKFVETYSKEPVEYIDFRNPNDVYVKIKTVNIRLGRIDETLFKRIERIPSILPQVKLVDSKVKYLDLSWEKVNYLKLE
ncbi:MAG: cell division protein FtsQ/DivIB [Candidatus Gastranaerophilaceae bacterium]